MKNVVSIDRFCDVNKRTEAVNSETKAGLLQAVSTKKVRVRQW
jgi:hypothetical protein